MKRRDFLKTSSLAFLMANGLLRNAEAFPTPSGRIVVNITLDGGPDFRHLLAPTYSSDENSYAFQYWQHRATAHAIDNIPAAYESRWNNDFLKPNGESFGILNSAAWLKSMWDSGNVAFINNVLASNSRDHAYSLLILEHGDRNSKPHDVDKPGWGGRLADAVNSKIVSLTHQPRRFCYGLHPNNSQKHLNKNLISMRDSRNMALFTPSNNPTSDSDVMNRALKSFYAAKRNLVVDSSPTPFDQLIQHENDLRVFSSAVASRLDTVTLPNEITRLYSGNATLSSRYLGRQIRNLYDALACHDILNFSVASMEYGGWDTHKNQKRFIEQRFIDLFGENQALHSLYQALPSEVADKLVFVISGEFGRQLKANGDAGTDHGRGNTVIVIGNDISGSVIGDMFPNTELNKLSNRSPDITGLTGIEQVFGAVCDWVQSGTSSTVFPDINNAPIESGVSISL